MDTGSLGTCYSQKVINQRQQSYILMRKSIFIVALMIVTCMAFAQKDLIESKSLVGIWQQARVTQSRDGNVKIVKATVYKVLNADKSFYCISITNNDLTTNVSICGSFKITSDSTYTESVTRHYTSPSMDNSESQMRFKLLDENTLLMQYYNEANKVWIPEIWVRVTPRKSVTNIN